MSEGSGFSKNVIMANGDNSSSVHADNRKKGISILGKGPTDESDDNTMTAETKYSINFSEQQNKFCLSLHYNVSNTFFVC